MLNQIKVVEGRRTSIRFALKTEWISRFFRNCLTKCRIRFFLIQQFLHVERQLHQVFLKFSGTISKKFTIVPKIKMKNSKKIFQ